MKILISIIIVNFNGKKWLKGCIDSIYRQSLNSFEIILVDNASSDESVEFVRKNYPSVKIIQNNSNLGFAEANNIGFLNSLGEYIFLLNNDTVILTKNLFENAVSSFNKRKYIAVIQPKLLLMRNKTKLDVCGSFWTPLTILYHYGYHQNASLKEYNEKFKVFSVKGAAMFIRRSIIEKIGLFDDAFWCYYEETDFCHRVWNVGYECWYFPTIGVVLHAEGGTSKKFDNSFIQFHNFKNKLRSYIKNFDGFVLFYTIIIYLFSLLIFMFYLLLQGKFSFAKSLLNSVIWNLKHFHETIALKKRAKLKNSLASVTITPRLDYYINMIKNFL